MKILSSVFAVVVLVTASPVAGDAGVVYRHVEDFTTTQYKDAANTTAFWNTTNGTIGFHPFAIGQLGNVATPGQATAVAYTGDHILVADGASGLQVVDVTDPTNPAIVGSAATGGVAHDVVIDGDFAYVAAGVSGVAIVNIMTPSDPLVVTTYDTPGDAQGLDLQGDLLCVADGGGGLRLLDVTLITVPMEVGASAVPTDARGVDLRGDVAFVADAASGLITVDVSNPAAPVALATLAAMANDVVVNGGIAYLADGTGGLVTANVSNPASPYQLAVSGTAGDASGVALTGDYVYVAEGSAGLRVLDAQDPAAPLLENTFVGGGGVRDVAVNGNYAYLADDLGLTIVEVSLRFPPVKVFQSNRGHDRVMIVDGDLVYTDDSDSYVRYIRVHDITDPENPYIVTTFYDGTNNYRDFVIQGDLMFAVTLPEVPAPTTYHFEVFDIEDPVSPVQVGDLAVGDLYWTDNLVPRGGYVFSRRHVFDVSDPTAPAIAATLRHHISHPVFNGNYMYGIDWDKSIPGEKLLTYDVTLPVAPWYWGESAEFSHTAARSRGAIVFGDILYVSGFDYLYTVDVSTPHSPVLVDTDALFSIEASNPLVAGDELIVSSRGAIEVFDISNPAAPAPKETTIPPFGGPNGDVIRNHGDYLIVYPFAVWRLWQRAYFYEEDVSQSSEIDQSNLNVVRALFTPTGSGDIDWYLSADGGANWQTVSPDVHWRKLTNPGSDLRWRAVHNMPADAVNAAATQVDIEWRFDVAVVDSVADVAGTGGDWARVHFTRSGYDFPGETVQPISYYEVYRQSDNEKVMTIFATTQDKYQARVPALGYGASEAFYIAAYTAGGTRYDGPPGSGASRIIVGTGGAPVEWGYALHQNAPNPFNPTTAIGYDVAAGGGAITLEIFDVSGRLVRTLVDGAQSEGEKRVLWDGRDNRGNRVASGVYIYRLRAPGFVESRKMTLVQ